MKENLNYRVVIARRYNQATRRKCGSGCNDVSEKDGNYAKKKYVQTWQCADLKFGRLNETRERNILCMYINIHV